MPLRSEYSIGREGFTFDTILSLAKHTVLNPLYTLPLYAYLLFTPKGREIAQQRPRLAQWLKSFAFWSVLRKTNTVLNEGILNNWKNDVYDWSKEVVVVTGGSDGIGAVVVQLLAEKGMKVVILDIQPPKYTTTPNVHYFHCDLASPSAIRYIAASINQHVGAPTILINNAGFARGNNILSASEADIKLTFQINTIAHYHLAQAFLPNMIARNHGMVVTVASMAAYVTAPSMVDYAASKAAALAFHEGLQAELATLHKAPSIRTIVVCPSYTRTPLFEGFHQGNGFLNYTLQPATVAEAIVRAVLRGQSDHIILPRASSYMAGFRNWPLWLQASVSRDLVKLMRNWRGRQVMQPSEMDATKEEMRTPVEGSTVLV